MNTNNLYLHFVSNDDTHAVMDSWHLDRTPISFKEANDVINNMLQNYKKNKRGYIYHLCLAVCNKEEPNTILGWCGLDGTVNQVEPEIFIVLCEGYRGMGIGSWCAKEVIRIATDEYGIKSIHGGCDKNNAASKRVLEKSGMVQYGVNEEGDPQFIYQAPMVK